MGTEKEEMILCSSSCFLIFLWSEGTFGEWQMLRWPVSLRSVHRISFLVTYTGLSPAPPQTSSPADRVVRDPVWDPGFTMTGPHWLYSVVCEPEQAANYGCAFWSCIYSNWQGDAVKAKSECHFEKAFCEVLKVLQRERVTNIYYNQLTEQQTKNITLLLVKNNNT